MKRWYSLLLLLGCSSIAEEFYLHDDTLYSSDIPLAQLFDSPVALTPTGIHYFLTHILSHPQYCKDILPHSFDHLMQLLRYNNETQQGNNFIMTIWRMFSTGVRSSLYIHADALDKLVRTIISDILKEGCSTQSSYRPKEDVADLLYDRFLKKFEVFKQDPESFFDRLSDDIVTKLTSDSDMNQVVTVMVIFLELCINKLAWSPQDEIKTWHTLLSIAECLNHLFDDYAHPPSHIVIDLHTSLVTRYCFFLELMRNEFSVEFFVALKHEVTHESAKFLDTVTIGSHSNREHLLQIITVLEAQIRAREYGYVALETKKHANVVVAQSDVPSEIKHLHRRKKRRQRRSSR
jgi:hypothetical protein